MTPSSSRQALLKHSRSVYRGAEGTAAFHPLRTLALLVTLSYLLGATCMHVHLPKPLHSWRALVGEVGIIVVGVLIALGAEQFVEAIHWHYKVQATEAAINTELGDDLRWALQVKQYDSCAGKFLDKFQAAVIAHDTPTVRKLAAIRDLPFPPAPWSYGTFTAALGSQVEDHLPPGRMAAYSREFAWVPLQMEFQVKLYEELATAMTARLGLAGTPDTLDRQLASIERLRSDQRGRLSIAEAMLDYGHASLSITPSNTSYIADNGAQAKACEAQLPAIGTTIKP